MNRNFAKPDENGYPIYAPDSVTVRSRTIHNPSAAHYRIAGFLPLRDEYPAEPAPAGKHWERTGKIAYSEDGQAVLAQYAPVADPPPPPRRWSRLSIKTALATAGMLDAAKAFLSATEIATGYTAWEALTDCDYIEEGYPDATRWTALLDGAGAALNRSRAEIDAFLATIPTENQP